MVPLQKQPPSNPMAPTASTNSQQEKMKSINNHEPPPLPFSFLGELFTPLSPLCNEEDKNQPPPRTQPPVCITLDQVRNGLDKNTRNDHNYITNNSHNNHSGPSSSLYDLTEDLNAHSKSHQEELDRLIVAQGEQLKRKLAEREQKQYTSLLRTAEESASKKLREKEASLDRAVRRAGEVQLQLERARREASELRVQSADKNQIILSLHSQLRRAQDCLARSGARRGGEGSGETLADDAESGCGERRGRAFAGAACRECGERRAEVVVLPCRHLCLCVDCNGTVAPLPCPVCRRIRTGYMHVLMN